MLAHLMNTGLGPFYDGLLHVFVTPEDLLPVVALALLAGQRGPAYGRAVLFALPALWLMGTACGRALGLLPGLPLAAAVLTIALGALAALDRPRLGPSSPAWPSRSGSCTARGTAASSRARAPAASATPSGSRRRSSFSSRSWRG